MKKLDANEYDYEDLDDVEMELTIFGGHVFIDTVLDRFEINEIALRMDGNPRLVMEYLIQDRPGEIVSIDEIRSEGKIPTSQNLQQLIRKIGFRGYTRDTFIPVFEKDKLKVLSKIRLSIADARLIIDELS